MSYSENPESYSIISSYTSIETFHCPTCLEVPLIKIKLKDDQIVVKAKCKCNKQEYEIKKFLRTFGEEFKQKLTCNFCKAMIIENSSNKFYFCKSCYLTYCSNCSYIHEKNNTNDEEHFLIDVETIDLKCGIHEKEFNSYCLTCNINLCEKCYLKHSNHIIKNLSSEKISDDIYPLVSSAYASAQAKILIEDEEQKNLLIENCKNEIDKEDITLLSQENRMENLSILNVIQVIFKMYNKAKEKDILTYPIIENIKNNINFNFEKFVYNKNIDIKKNIINFYDFVKKNIIIEKECDIEDLSEIHRFHIENEKYINIFEDIIKIFPKYEIKNKEDEIETNVLLNFQKCIYYGDYNITKKECEGRGIQINLNKTHYIGFFSNGKKDNIGIYFFKQDKCQYKGFWKNNLMNGYGTYTFSDGSIYEGEWENNKRHGFGILTFPNNEKYLGEFKNGKIEGIGIFYYKNNRTYKGEFLNNTKHGYGIEKIENGEIYEGFWEKGKRNGIGKITFPNDTTYLGNISNNILSGFGIFTDNKNNIQYKGNFIKGSKEGLGYFIYKNGNKYKGYFKNNKKDGFGILYYKNGDKYIGEWTEDKKDGIGEFTTKTGDFYKGRWVKDYRMGIGEYRFASNCAFYMGDWVKDLRHGYGIYRDKKGNVYEGPFENNFCHGNATYYSFDGSKFECIFIHGERKNVGTYESLLGNDFEIL
jgi:hypothetical protein